MQSAPPTFDEYGPSTSASAGRKARGEEADIGQTGASARSSAATAAEKEATLPSTVREGKAKATTAEIEAEQAQIALDKLKRLTSGLPEPKNLARAQREVLVELRNLVTAKELSATALGATGFGHTTTSLFSGSPGATVQSLLKPIQANAAFEALNKMRQESPTGGALGNVTERELELLYSKEGAIDPKGSDKTFQQGVDDLIANRIEVLNKLNVDPAQVAEILGPQNIDKFGPMVTSYRFRPEDENALANYVKTTKANGTFDPTDYAALMAQAYYSATGKQADENFVLSALKTGQTLGQGKGTAVGPIDYNRADEDARKFIFTRVKGQQPDGLSWGEAVGGAALNFIPSTFELATDTVKALTVNLPDTIEGVANIVAGATGISDDETAWNAVKDYYVDRYGSLEGFKKALSEDPASIMADVAGIASGGALLVGKIAGTAGKVSRIAALSNAAKKAEGFADFAAKVDPINIALGTTKLGAKGVIKGADVIGVGIPAKAAGVTRADVKQSVQAGREGSPEFLAQMTETGDVADPIAKAQKAVTELYQQRSTDYTRRMEKLKRNPEALSFDDVEKSIEGVRNIGRHKGIDISSAADVWDQVDAKTMEFFDKGLNTIEDFDAMKRAIGNIRDTYQRGTPQYRVANDVAKAINSTIVEKAPIYANIMNDYRVASDVLSDVTASLSTGAKSADTTLNKLRRVASGKGARGRTVLDLLEGTPSGKGLGNVLAGQTMSSPEAGGLTPTISAGTAMAAGSPEPLLGAFMSPRTLGTAAYRTGEVLGGAERMFGRAERMFGRAMDLPGASVLADIYERYAPDTAQGARQGVRIANPALIQPQVSDFEYAPPSEEDIRAALTARYMPSSPSTSLVDDQGVSLEALRSKYEGPTLPSLRPKKKDEEEEVVVEETGFARGGRVFAPSVY